MYYCHGIYDLLAMQVATCSGRAIRSKKTVLGLCLSLDVLIYNKV